MNLEQLLTEVEADAAQLDPVTNRAPMLTLRRLVIAAPVLAKVVRELQRQLDKVMESDVPTALHDSYYDRVNDAIDRIVAEHTEPRAAVEDGDEHGVPR